jgi:hypothetical protein
LFMKLLSGNRATLRVINTLNLLYARSAELFRVRQLSPSKSGAFNRSPQHFVIG